MSRRLILEERDDIADMPRGRSVVRVVVEWLVIATALGLVFWSLVT